MEGNRGERVLAMAARAYAALQAAPQVTLEHLEGVAPLALQHRRPEMVQSNQTLWTDKDQMLLRKTLGSE